MTHIGSGFASEIESSLDILLDLAQHHIHQMAPFAVFVKVSLFLFLNIQIKLISCTSCANARKCTNIG